MAGPQLREWWVSLEGNGPPADSIHARRARCAQNIRPWWWRGASHYAQARSEANFEGCSATGARCGPPAQRSHSDGPRLGQGPWEVTFGSRALSKSDDIRIHCISHKQTLSRFPPLSFIQAWHWLRCNDPSQHCTVSTSQFPSPLQPLFHRTAY